MLGIILAPYGQIPGAYPSGIMYSYGPSGEYLEPHDPQYNTRGEAGYYHDTALGGGSDPTDFDIAAKLGNQYTPVSSGWVAFQDNYWPAPWTPPNGWRPQGMYAPQPWPRSLGDAPATADDVLAAINDHNQKIFTLSIISTLAVAVSAIFTTYRTTRLLREDRKRNG